MEIRKYMPKITWNLRQKRNKSHLPAQKWREHQKVFPNINKSVVYIGGHRKNRLR